MNADRSLAILYSDKYRQNAASQCVPGRVNETNGNIMQSEEFYILATFKVISGPVLICDSMHSWRFYSAASLEHKATGTMTCYHIIPTLSQPVLTVS